MAHPRRWRQILERTALVGLGLWLVAACEVVVRLVAPSTIGAGGPPLYVRAEGEAGGQNWVLSPARRRWLPEQSFSARRPEHGVLIFCVGGSDVYGYPYGAAYAFPSRLQRLLAAAHPERLFEVVNVGGMSYGSERLVGLVEELVKRRMLVEVNAV